ncbi:MAG: hypothetical protein ABIQ73_29830 [Acidimicrobiales bacterium]
MAVKVAKIVDEIEGELRSRGTPERAAQEQRYLKANSNTMA